MLWVTFVWFDEDLARQSNRVMIFAEIALGAKTMRGKNETLVLFVRYAILIVGSNGGSEIYMVDFSAMSCWDVESERTGRLIHRLERNEEVRIK